MFLDNGACFYCITASVGMTQAHLENGHRAQNLLEIDLLKTRQRDLNAVVSIAIGFGLDLRIGS